MAQADYPPESQHPRDDEAETAATMSLGDHLEALRKRLISGLIGIAIASLATMIYGRDIVAWLCEPLFVAQRELGLPQQTINLSVAGGFTIYVKVSMLAGMVIGIPWATYQLWKFIAPGLRQNEQRAFRVVVPYSSLMTVLSVLFAYYVFLPAAISFLLLFSLNYPISHSSQEHSSSLEHVTTWFNKLNMMMLGPGSSRPAIAPPAKTVGEGPAAERFNIPVRAEDPPDAHDGDVWLNPGLSELRIMNQGRVRAIALTAASAMVPQIEINEYLNFVFLVGLIMLLAFQLPVIMTIAAMLGMYNPRTLGRYRKVIVFSCFVIGIVITPNQDVVSNVVFPFLLWGLFEVGLVTSRAVQRKPEA